MVRDAFIKKGHQAISCDLLNTISPGPHIIGDCQQYSWKGYDLIIAHPPCTYLCSSGLHWNKKDPTRNQKTLDALAFVQWIMNLPCPKIAIENPVGCISTKIRKPDQIIQPWQFGKPESKATCLWLKGLPPLIPTNILSMPSCGYWNNQTPSGQNKLGPSKNRALLRSLTYQGIADAMADQWK